MLSESLIPNLKRGNNLLIDVVLPVFILFLISQLTPSILDPEESIPEFSLTTSGFESSFELKYLIQYLQDIFQLAFWQFHK